MSINVGPGAASTFAAGPPSTTEIPVITEGNYGVTPGQNVYFPDDGELHLVWYRYTPTVDGVVGFDCFRSVPPPGFSMTSTDYPIVDVEPTYDASAVGAYRMPGGASYRYYFAVQAGVETLVGAYGFIYASFSAYDKTPFTVVLRMSTIVPAGQVPADSDFPEDIDAEATPRLVVYPALEGRRRFRPR